MDLSRDRRAEEGAQRPQRIDDNLHLDHVVASQPEIGPTPPDGGYGWLVVASAAMYHLTVPGLFMMYGFVILKSIRGEDHVEGENLRMWDVDLALVPVVMVVIRLLLESWCRMLVSVVNMPRFMALAGLCLTVAGVLLSSYSTDADSTNHIVNLFAGLFTGSGCALTGQQTELIITHYFRAKLAQAQRIVRLAPSVGNCLIPIIIGLLCSNYTGDVVVMIYAAILMQNSLFLVVYTRPIYIERVIRNTYRMLIDATEDDDEVIFSNNNVSGANAPSNINQPSATNPNHSNAADDADDHIVVFNSKANAKEVIDPAVQLREKNEMTNASRFSSDFATIYNDEYNNRFSSNFGDLNIRQDTNRYQELETIDRITQNPQPLYRETTVNNPMENSLSFVTDPNMTSGSIRRTASLKKNFFTVMNMLRDIDFYLYTFLHLSTTFGVLVFGVLFPPLIWEQTPTLNIWKVSTTIAITNAAAFCLIIICAMLPKAIHEKHKMCSVVCFIGAMGFYGITLSSTRTFLVLWGLFASFSTSTSSIVLQPIYNNVLSEFDTTATITTANAFVAIFIMIWSISFGYEYKTCFFTTSILLALTGILFVASSFKRRR